MEKLADDLFLGSKFDHQLSQLIHLLCIGLGELSSTCFGIKGFEGYGGLEEDHSFFFYDRLPPYSNQISHNG